MARLPALVRQTKVFDLVVQGKTYEQICKQLKVSEDTVARDMTAIAEQVQTLVRERHGEILAFALANYNEVLQHAWSEYRAEAQREKDWWAGKLDVPITERSTKTLEVGPQDLPQRGTETDDDADDDLGAVGDFINGLEPRQEPPDQPGQPDGREVSLPLEVRTKQSTVRPVFRSQRAQWLKLAIEATREITELTGLKRLQVEHSGTVETVTMTLEEWKAEQAKRRAAAEATLALLDEAGDA